MTIKAVISFNEPSSFTFDPDEILFSLGSVFVKTQVRPDELSYFNFDTPNDFTATRGNFPFTKTGNPNVQGGKLEFLNNRI